MFLYLFALLFTVAECVQLVEFSDEGLEQLRVIVAELSNVYCWPSIVLCYYAQCADPLTCSATCTDAICVEREQSVHDLIAPVDL